MKGGLALSTPGASRGTADLQAVWSGARHDVHAVGRGVALHFDGAEWHALLVAPDAHLEGIWGGGPRDVFAVGGSRVWHFDGERWALAQELSGNPALVAVWGRGPRDAYVAGAWGTIHHYDGQRWSPLVDPPPADAPPPDLRLPPRRTLHALGGNDREVIAVGGEREPWQPGLPRPAERPLALHARRAAPTRAGWSPQPVPPDDAGQARDFVAAWFDRSGAGHAVGTAGQAARYDGTRWSAPQRVASAHLRAVWGSQPRHVHAVGDAGTILHFDGEAWRQVAGGRGVFNGIWCGSASNALVVGPLGALLHPWDAPKGVLLHYDGRIWVELATDSSGVEAITGTPTGELFAIGGSPSAMLHYDGQRWTTDALPASLSLRALTTCSEGAGTVAFAVGEGEAILRLERAPARTVPALPPAD